MYIQGITRAAVLLAAALPSGCAVIGTPAGIGFLYTDITHPTQVIESEIPRQMLRGEACSQNILGLFTFGDSGIVAATLDGDVRRIRIVEQQSKVVLGIAATHCTIVWGD